MKALLDQQGGTCRPLLTKAGVNLSLLRNLLDQALEKLSTVSGADSDIRIGNSLNRFAKYDR